MCLQPGTGRNYRVRVLGQLIRGSCWLSRSPGTGWSIVTAVQFAAWSEHCQNKRHATGKTQVPYPGGRWFTGERERAKNEITETEKGFSTGMMLQKILYCTESALCNKLCSKLAYTSLLHTQAESTWTPKWRCSHVQERPWVAFRLIGLA
jgi:hypothetical protein